MDEGSEKTKPIQSQFIRIAYCVMRIAKRDFAKQSQFVPALIGLNSSIGDSYENRPAFGMRKNKAKQRQFAGLRPETLSTKL